MTTNLPKQTAIRKAPVHKPAREAWGTANLCTESYPSMPHLWGNNARRQPQLGD